MKVRQKQQMENFVFAFFLSNYNCDSEHAFYTLMAVCLI